MYGQLLPLTIIPLILKPRFKQSILIFAAIIPVLIFNWGTVPSESYRQLHLNSVMSFVVFFCYLASLNSQRYRDVRRLCLRILVAYSVLHAIMIHKFYLIPEVQLNLMAVDTPPHPDQGGWLLGLRGFQKVTPMVFVVTFVMWLLVLISKDRIRAILTDWFKRGPRICSLK